MEQKRLVNLLIKSLFTCPDWNRKKADDGLTHELESTTLKIKIVPKWLFFYAIYFNDPIEFKIIVNPLLGLKLWIAIRICHPDSPQNRRKQTKIKQCINTLETQIKQYELRHER